MDENIDDEQLALRHLSHALQALDRTEHAQVAAIASHALEMLLVSGSFAAAPLPAVELA